MGFEAMVLLQPIPIWRFQGSMLPFHRQQFLCLAVLLWLGVPHFSSNSFAARVQSMDIILEVGGSHQWMSPQLRGGKGHIVGEVTYFSCGEIVRCCKHEAVYIPSDLSAVRFGNPLYGDWKADQVPSSFVFNSYHIHHISDIYIYMYVYYIYTI